MIKRYTFLKHPFYFVVENSKNMVAGLDKCIAVFYKHTSNTTDVLKYEKELSTVSIEDVGFVEDLRVSKKRANWIQFNQVPFEFSKTEGGQLSFEDEKNSTVLELRFLNPYDGKYDILYLYFKNNIGNFKLSNVNEAMAVEVKQVIQNLLYNEVLLILKSNTNNTKIHQKIALTHSDNHLQGEINQLKQKKFEDDQSNYAFVLNKLTASEDVEFVLSNQAVKKLSQSSLSLDEIERLLFNSIEVIVNKYNPSSFYEISVNDINFTSISEQPTLSIKQESLNKSQLFLDKYEAAAKILLSKNEKITGLNIGEHCSPRVSPAAISDILKKHQKKIILLFEQHPERWPTIRTKFKPIIKIYERLLYKNSLRKGA